MLQMTHSDGLVPQDLSGLVSGGEQAQHPWLIGAMGVKAGNMTPPLKKKGGHEPITNKTRWTQEVRDDIVTVTGGALD